MNYFKCINCKKKETDLGWNNFNCQYCNEIICCNCYSNYSKEKNWFIYYCSCQISICSNCIKNVKVSENFKGEKDKNGIIDKNFVCYKYFKSIEEHNKLEENLKKNFNK